MSRSLWAWKGWAPVSALLRRTGDETRLGSQRRVRCEQRPATITQAPRYLWVLAATGLAFALVPQTALADHSSPRAHPQSTHNQPPRNWTDRHSAGSRPARPDPRTCGLSARRLLAPGSGYFSANGSCSVRALQRRLAHEGFAPGPIDGRYGPHTDAAVRAYQEAHGLLADGIAGPITLASLRAARPALYPGAGYGTEGSAAVRAVQRRLRSAGYPPGPIDGRYGPLTEAAVRRFQHASRLTPDGIAGPHTLAALPVQSAPRPRVRTRPGTHRAARPTPRTHNPARPRPSTHKPARPTPPASKPGGVARPRTTAKRSHPGLAPWIPLAALLLLGLPVAIYATGRKRRQRRTLGPSTRGTAGTAGGDVPAPRPGPAPAATAVPLGERSVVEPAGDAAPADERNSRLRQRDRQHDGDRGHQRERQRPRVRDGHNDRVSEPSPATNITTTKETNHGQTQQQEDEQEGLAAFTLGGVLANKGDFAGAEAAYRRAAEHGHADAASNLGVLLEQRGELKAAEAAYRDADQQGAAAGALNLAGLLADRGDLDAAEAAYWRAAARGDTSAAYHVGQLLTRRGELQQAQTAYRQADRGGHAEAATNLGQLLEQEGDLTAAKAAYERGSDRGDPTAAFNLAGLLSEQGDLSGAEAAYHKADKQGHADAASNLGVLLEQKGQLDDAEAAYRRADQRGHAIAAYNLANLLEERGDVAGAEAAYERAEQRGEAELKQLAQDALQQLRHNSKRS